VQTCGTTLTASVRSSSPRQNVREWLPKCTIPTVIPADALISIAEAVDADLVVVGNRGMTGVKRFVLGSVPNKGVPSVSLQLADRRH